MKSYRLSTNTFFRRVSRQADTDPLEAKRLAPVSEPFEEVREKGLDI
jgi:hypothetical protein